jgi:glycosyltransferase involved in cell wall biosynthesis
MWASVVVITKDQRAFLERSLPILAAQNVPSGGGFEVIVVDSGSADGAQNVVRAYAPLARLVEIAPASFGYARAHNVGASRARGEFLARLSGDAVPVGPNWLRELVAPFDNPAVAATWGRQALPPTVKNPWSALPSACLRRAPALPARTGGQRSCSAPAWWSGPRSGGRALTTSASHRLRILRGLPIGSGAVIWGRMFPKPPSFTGTMSQ